jgi:hypothetical protein
MQCPTHGGQEADNHADLNQWYALVAGTVCKMWQTVVPDDGLARRTSLEARHLHS